jgi:hypothetical protein
MRLCHINRRALGHDCWSHSCAHMHDCQEHSRACMHNCDLHRRAPHAHLFSSLEHPHARLSKIQPHTHAWESFDRPCTGGATLTKTPCTTPVQPCPKNKTLSPMQEDTTTNLKLTDPGTTASITQNLQISSQIARPLTKTTSTNEVALWALQLYIVLFANIPDSIPGAPNIHFSIRLQPRDQNPITYTIIFPRPLSILCPRGAFFSYPHSGTHAHIHFLLNNCYMFFIFRYCSHQVFGFHVCRYLVILHQCYPFRYIIDTGMQSFPLNIICISSNTL